MKHTIVISRYRALIYQILVHSDRVPLKAAVTHLADNGCSNQLIIGDYNSSINRDLDYVGYTGQDPHQASKDFLFGLQEDDVFIDVYRFLHP